MVAGPLRGLEWLADGSARQRAAWAALVESRIFERLAPWDPVLAGTFPLDLDIEGSDLDVLVCASDLDALERFALEAFGDRTGCRARRLPEDPEALVVGFAAGAVSHEVPIEVFAQPVPVRDQVAYRHLVVERRLLAVGGEALRARVRDLKRSGRNTEAAFAELLGLPGDPFAALLELETEEELERWVAAAGLRDSSP